MTPPDPPTSAEADHEIDGRLLGLATLTLAGTAGGVLSKIADCVGVALLRLPAASTARTA